MHWSLVALGNLHCGTDCQPVGLLLCLCWERRRKKVNLPAFCFVTYRYVSALGQRCQHSARAVLQDITFEHRYRVQNNLIKWLLKELDVMMMISTVGVESSHGHDVAANVDGGTSLPGDDKIEPE